MTNFYQKLYKRKTNKQKNYKVKKKGGTSKQADVFYNGSTPRNEPYRTKLKL